MFSYKSLAYTLSVLLLAGLIYWRTASQPVAADGEDKPADQAAPKDGEALLNSIPVGPLDEGVLLQAGDIKIQFAAVEKTENALIASRKGRDPQFKMTPEMQVSLRKNVAFSLLRNALVERYVKDNNLAAPKDRVTEQFERFKTEMSGQGMTYDQFLKDNAIDEADFMRVLTASCAIEQQAAATVKDEDISKMYEQYKVQLDRIDKEDPDRLPLRRVSHILFMYKGSDRAPETVTRTKDEAKAAAEDALKQLQGGKDFAELAKASSDCPSKAQGGDLNYFPRKDAMAEPFSEAAYKLEKSGDLTSVVETPFGFHVIKLTDLRTPATMKTEMQTRLKSDIRDNLVGEKVGKQIQQLLQECATKAKFNEKLIPAIPKEAPKGLNVFPKEE